MPKLTTSYWSHKWNKYIMIQEQEINRAVANRISRHFIKATRVEGFFRYYLENNYASTVYFSDEAVKIISMQPKN